MSSSPLTPTQQGMLFHSQLSADPSVYLQQFVWTLREPLDQRLVEAAWTTLFDRHEILRAAVVYQQGEEATLRIASEVTPPVEWVDRRSVGAEERRGQLKADLSADRASGIDCTIAPAMRIQIFSYGEEDHTLVWTYHHAFLDGRSRAIAVEEFFAVFDALTQGETPELPSPSPFRRYPEWLANIDPVPAERFWSDLLGEVESPTPLCEAGYPSTAQVGTGHLEIGSVVDTARTAELKQVAASRGLTINTLIQAAWALLLRRYSGEESVLFGATRSGRRIPGVDTGSMIGLLINTLPMKLAVPDTLPLGEWLEEVRSLWVSMRPYEHTSPLLFQRCSALPPGTPLFNSIVVVETSDLNETCHSRERRWPGRSFQLYQHTHYPLTLSVKVGSSLHLSLEVAPEQFSPKITRQLLGCLESLLYLVGTADPATPLGALSPPPEKALATIEQRWKECSVALPEVPSFVTLFEQLSARQPQRPALRFGEERLSYGALNGWANQVAHFLAEQGIEPGDSVACCISRSPAMVAALLGILKAGARYIPLDPIYPRKRIQLILKDAGEPHLLTESRLRTLFDGDQPILEIEAVPFGADHYPTTNPPPLAHLESGAYLIYTSGSTGRPKGVEVGHRALLNLLCSMAHTPGMTASDTLLAVTTISFDIAALELFLPLIVGGTTQLASAEEAADGQRLAATLQQGATLLQATPTTWYLLLASGWKGTRGLKMLCGGEKLPMGLARSLLEKGGELWNMYGPTETTIWSSCARVTHDSLHGAHISIGQPVDNTLLLVADPQLHPCPPGMAGELMIGGTGLAEGYANRRELTRRQFIDNPFPVGGQRLYRTGDRAKFLDDGSLIYLQRLDHQIKLRGYRIEPGEIESVINRHPNVVQSVVTLIEEEPNNHYLAAYMEVVEGTRSSPAEFRELLRPSLPDYMTPSVFISMDALPKTPNGKLDRKSLPKPGRAHLPQEHPTQPRTLLEMKLLRLWRNALQMENLGIGDSFFDHGGHSLKAVALVGRMERELGCLVPISALFKYQTVEQMASHLEAGHQGWSADESLVVFRERGSKPPLFFIHPVGGNPLCYLELCQLLGDDQPCYGLQMERAEPTGLLTVKALAERHLRTIRSAATADPIRIAAWSFGGLVALEIGRMLIREGHPPEPLMLIETRLPNYSSSPQSEVLLRQEFLKDLAQGRPSDALHESERSENVEDLYRAALAHGLLPKSTSDAHFGEMFRVYCQNRNAMRSMNPGPYPGEVRLLHGTTVDAEYRKRWEQLVGEGLHAQALEGDHYSLLQYPSVARVAKWISAGGGEKTTPTNR